MVKFREGDTVRLVSLSIHKNETRNWLLKEKAQGFKIELYREFTVDDVDYGKVDGWISLQELNHYHPADKFELVRRVKNESTECNYNMTLD